MKHLLRMAVMAAVLFGSRSASADLSVTYDASTGLLQLDTDVHDFVNLYVSTGVVDFTAAGTCLLCDGGMLGVFPNEQTFSASFAAGTSQWERTDPLAGPGLSGVFDLAIGPLDLDNSDFPLDFGPGSDDSFVLGTSLGEQFYGDVTVINSNPVPLPSAVVLGMIGLPLAGWMRRRFA